MRSLRLFLVALLVLFMLTPLTLLAQSSDAQRRHPRPGQNREYRNNDRDRGRSYRQPQRHREYRPNRHHRSPRYDYRPQYRNRGRHGYRGYYRPILPMCVYQTGYWAEDRYGEYFVPTGSYIAPCR